jgi:hypothetical protein
MVSGGSTFSAPVKSVVLMPKCVTWDGHFLTGGCKLAFGQQLLPFLSQEITGKFSTMDVRMLKTLGEKLGVGGENS